MRSLGSTLRALCEHGTSLPEPYCDCFTAAPPSEARWPEGLPFGPYLRDFYAACNGGNLGSFSFLPLGSLADETASTADWMTQTTEPDGLPPKGRWLKFGSNEYDHALIWDADRDALLVYDSDGGDLWDADEDALAYDGSGPGPTGRLALARFFERLMNPAVDSADEFTREWAKALQYLDRLT